MLGEFIPIIIAHRTKHLKAQSLNMQNLLITYLYIHTYL